jgi:hypothetical protein
MGASVVALIYAWLSLAGAFMLAPWSLPLSLRLRAIILWAFAAIVFFTLQDWIFVLILVAFAAAVLAPIGLARRAAFFLVAAPCLPSYIDTPIPFPGINFLLDLTHYKATALILLLPLFFYRRPKNSGARSASILDTCLIVYIAYTAFVVADVVNLTTGLRHLVNLGLTLALPYFALRYAIQNLEDIESCFDAFVLATTILATVTLVSAFRQWDFYWLSRPPSATSVAEFRSGLLRVSATLNVHSLAYHLAAGLLVLQCIGGRLQLHWMKYLALRLSFFTALLLTGSRGAVAGFAAALGFYAIVIIRGNAVRAGLSFIAIWVIFVASVWLLFGETATVDAHGTVQYRQLLIRIGVNHILQYPIFGDYNFFLRPNFEPLRQAQGIIDITNLYLQILLHYGFVGGLLFFSVLMLPIITLIRLTFVLNGRTEVRSKMKEKLPRRRGKLEKWKSQARPAASVGACAARWQRATAGVVSVQMGWLVLVATTSDVSLTLHLGFIFAALCRSLSELGAQLVQKNKIDSVENESRRDVAGVHIDSRGKPARVPDVS